MRGIFGTAPQGNPDSLKGIVFFHFEIVVDNLSTFFLWKLRFVANLAR